jgi:hypothetical protein
MSGAGITTVLLKITAPGAALMKRLSMISLAGLLLAFSPAARSQPSQSWDNWGTVQVPPAIAPQIDAVTFFNHQGAIFNVADTTLFSTADTLNFTNQGTMLLNPGFDVETFPTTTGSARRASSFANLASGPNSGIIDISGALAFIVSPNLVLGNLTGNSEILVNATNIHCTGTINMDASSLMSFRGENVNVSRGNLQMTTTSSTTAFGTNAVFIFLFNAGLLDGYWGVGTADPKYPQAGQASMLFPQNLLFGFNQSYNITTRDYFPGATSLFLNNPLYYIDDTGVVGSNRVVKAVVLVNTNQAFANTVYFPGEIAVQWAWNSTNLITHKVSTNYLYLTDIFGEITNLQVGVDGFKNPQAPIPPPTYMPVNYNFISGVPFQGIPSSPTIPNPFVFGNGQVTNQYSAYEAIFTAGTQLPTDVAGGDVTNMQGRIELVADKALNLDHARITSLNYTLLKTTNHFMGSAGAQITSPWFDFILASTNGTMTISNLDLPYIDHPEGTIELWSGRWTNVTGVITNNYHVLFVNSQLAPIMPQRVQTLNLSVTNPANVGPHSIYIGDVLNVSRSMTINAQRLTITTNVPGSIVPNGQLNLLSSDILWSTATPGLQYLTNWGSISTLNAVYFGGSRTQPPYNTNIIDIPYQAFVNHGFITNDSSLIWSLYFENNGGFQTTGGSIVLQQCANAMLRDGSFNSPAGDISFGCNNLTISNTVLQAGAAITFSVTNSLDDSSLYTPVGLVTNKNSWSVDNGVNLLVLPNSSSLSATTITNTESTGNEIVNTWAGADLGCSPAGFTNNAQIGRLYLVGQDAQSLFTFAPAGANNAIYVDYLEFQGSLTTNRDSDGNFSGVQVLPGMKVYFGQAVANGVSIAEKLTGKNGGGFCWVSNYNTGFYSSTNFVYPDGTTNQLNAALVSSCDIDSDGDGIVNCQDPTPVYIPSSLGLKVTVTGTTTRTALISWDTLPHATNYLYSVGSAGATNWQLVTSFVAGPVGGRVQATDPIHSGGLRFYKVRVATP